MIKSHPKNSLTICKIFDVTGFNSSEYLIHVNTVIHVLLVISWSVSDLCYDPDTAGDDGSFRLRSTHTTQTGGHEHTTSQVAGPEVAPPRVQHRQLQTEITVSNVAFNYTLFCFWGSHTKHEKCLQDSALYSLCLIYAMCAYILYNQLTCSHDNQHRLGLLYYTAFRFWFIIIRHNTFHILENKYVFVTMVPWTMPWGPM